MTSKAQKIHQQIQQKQQNKSKAHEQFLQPKKCSILLLYLSRDWSPGLLTQQS